MATILNLNQDCRWNIARVFPEICYISKVVSRYFGRKYDFQPLWDLETRSRCFIMNKELFYYSKYHGKYIIYDKSMISNIENIIEYDHLQRYFYHLDNELYYVGYNFAIDEKAPMKCSYLNISNINIYDGKIVERAIDEIYENGLETISVMNEKLVEIKPGNKRPVKLEANMTGRKYLFIHPTKLTNCFIQDGKSFYIPSNLKKWSYIKPVKAILQCQKELYSSKNIWYLILFGYKIVCLRTVLPRQNVRFISWREISIKRIMDDSIVEKINTVKSISYNLKTWKNQ